MTDIVADPKGLLEAIEQEFIHALDMAQKARAGEVQGYSNPFDTGSQWIEHAHQLLKMRVRILGEEVPETAVRRIKELEAELTQVRAEFSEMFRISMENGREATQFLAGAISKKEQVSGVAADD